MPEKPARADEVGLWRALRDLRRKLARAKSDLRRKADKNPFWRF